MTRRQWFHSTAAAAAGSAASASVSSAQSPPATRKPPVLKPGDTVACITPSTYVVNPDTRYLAERMIRHFGLKAKFGRHVGKRYGYVGGSIEERVEDLHWAFSDPESKAVFCTRGGYGAGQLLNHINYSLIARNPKILLGYSDITALHLALQRKTGLVTFHGPTVLSPMSRYTEQHLRRALFETKPLGVVTNPPDSGELRPRHLLRAIRGGKASGPLVGGNLSLIAATMGTPYEVDTRGKIFFIEDVDEQPYSVDRMLTNLRLAGKLEQAAGVIWGECSDCTPRDYKPSFESTISTAEVVQNILGGLKVPVLYGLTIGHTEDQLTLPEGVMATLDADRGELNIEEAAVTP